MGSVASMSRASFRSLAFSAVRAASRREEVAVAIGLSYRLISDDRESQLEFAQCLDPG